VTATSARPTEPPVQFSRKRLSMDVALLVVVVAHIGNQLQKVNQPVLTVKAFLRQRTPTGVAPPFKPPTPDALHNPQVESIELPPHIRTPIVHAPPPDQRVQDPNQLLQRDLGAATRQRPHVVLEPINRSLPRYCVQADTAQLETQPRTQPDLVAQELETLTDVDYSGFIRMNPKTQFAFQHRTAHASARSASARVRHTASRSSAYRVSRAGMLISVVRMVAVRALPSFPSASTAAARDTF
jgi:hypothetical protein